MKRMLMALTVLAASGIAGGCSRDATNRLGVPAPSADVHDAITLDRLARSVDGGVAELTSGARVIVVPAGSVNALAAAITAAGSGGAVILRAGTHTESHGVTISRPVSLIGENGALLKVDTHADFADVVVDPAIHVKNTTNVVVWGLEIRPVGAVGGTAILVERSPNLVIANNRIFEHQNSIVLHYSDQTFIWGNTVVVTGAWLTGEVLEADGILAVNGQGIRIVGNDVSNGFFGVFASGPAGSFTANSLHENYFGVIFCRVPAGALQLPGGELIGSAESANLWNAYDNKATGNLDAGYLVIDGAHHNTLSRNAASGNALYDYDLVGESTRFGFCTPASFQNTVRATGRFANVTIKDCGKGDTIVGGHLVDTSLDPCDAPCPAQAVASDGGGSTPGKCAAAFLNNRPKKSGR